MRCRLYNDNSLMIAGSNSFISGYSTDSHIIPTSYPIDNDNLVIKHKANHYSFNAPFIVKESGVFVLFFVIGTDQSVQFSVYVNGVLLPLTTIGNNSGTGQLVSRHLLALKKDDNVVVRNYLSAGPINLTVNAGGTQVGVNESFLLYKIAPLNEDLRIDCDWEEECLPKHTLALFRKLKNKVMDDDH